MAIKVTNQVWTIPPSADVTRAERAVLLCLADHCRHDAETPSAWPSVPRIAERTGMTRRGVQKVMRRLEERGVIVATGREKNNVVVYTLELSVLTPQAANEGANAVRGLEHSVRPQAANAKPSSSERGDAKQRTPFARSGINRYLTGRRAEDGANADRVRPRANGAAVRPNSPPFRKKNPEKAKDYGDDPPPLLTEHPDLIKAWIERHHPDMLKESTPVQFGPEATAFDRLSPARKVELEDLARADPRFAAFLERAPLAEEPRMIVHWINRYLKEPHA